MNYQSDIVDIFDLMASDDDEIHDTDESLEYDSNQERELLPVDEALVKCLNSFGYVDIKYISEVSGLSVDDVVYALRGTILQDPKLFVQGKAYSIEEDWVVSEKYMSGNIRKKLEIAKRANSMYPGVFSANIEKINSVLPERVDIDDIHISIGASWIPPSEVAEFIASLLRLKNIPKVHYYKELLTYKIDVDDNVNRSILNTITYGVRADSPYYTGGSIKQYLTAIDIIEQTLNSKTVKVYDYIPKAGTRMFEYEAVLNQTKTVEAQDKQKAILDAFRDFVYKKKDRIARFEQYYNDKFVGYTYTRYDGAFLKLPGINPEVTLYQHQRDAVARVLLSGNNVLLAHNVGTGKTYEMIVSVHEMHRMGLSRKNLLVVPNNVLKASADAHKYLYKDDNILVIYPKDFTPDKRNEVLKMVRDNDYDAIYMAYSSFDMIVMSKDYYVHKMSTEIKSLSQAAYNATVKTEGKALKKRKESLVKKLSKYVLEEDECEWITFDELGINTLVVDEAHNYKNIDISTRADGIIGMGGSSKKCREMLEKAHYVDRVIFATGTPLTNSLADLFAFQTYLQPETLKLHKINTFDAWIGTFGQRETAIECDVDANSKSLRTMTRFSSFHNLSELMSIFSQVCDFHNIDEKEEGLPSFNGPIDITVPKNEAQHEYINKLSERTDLIRTRKVRRTEDNLLKVTTDGRMAALDIRLVKHNGPYDCRTRSKTDACAEKIFEIYNAYSNSTQVVFSDIGTPKAQFNVYDELAGRLIELGVPHNEIAFVHDATTERARAKLFADMNSAKVRVVIGSTAKLGVGVNVQERLVALHHLSVPWRPADMVQREGRILRKGNTSEEVFIFRYITEGSFDAYSWQLLENKQRFISSFLSGTSAARDMEDIADAVLSYAEVKALAIGNPLIKKRVEVANTLERAKIVYRSRQRELQQLKLVVDTVPEKIKGLRLFEERARKDCEYYKKSKEPIPNEERIAFGEELLEALRDNIEKKTERFFDKYQGFTVLLPANMDENYPHIIIYSPSRGCYRCDISLENKSPKGCSMSIDYILEHLSERADKLAQDILLAEKQVSEAKDNLKKDNPFGKDIERLRKELARIDKQLDDQAKDSKAS